MVTTIRFSVDLFIIAALVTSSQGRLVEFTNALITLMMELPQESIQARTQQITALSDAQLTSFPGSTDNESRLMG